MRLPETTPPDEEGPRPHSVASGKTTPLGCMRANGQPPLSGDFRTEWTEWTEWMLDKGLRLS